MLYSILNDDNTYYLNVHAECALQIHSNYFMDEDDEVSKAKSRQEQGIYCNKVNADVFAHIYQYPYEGKNLCVDFNHIQYISENNLVSFVDFIKTKFCGKNKNVYLLNMQKNILDKMNLREEYEKIAEEAEIVSCKIGKAKDVFSYQALTRNFQQLFEDKIDKMICDCTDELERDERHMSVPVYLSKYINVKRMAETNSRFLRLGIYYLGKRLIEKNILSSNYSLNKDTNLFFHTICGGYIATQLAQLFNINMVYLDHLGPLESIHRKHFEKSVVDNKNYIIVSDVICLGGEVGRAKTIVEYCGGKICGEVCIVDIKTIEKVSGVNRVSLYSISKKQNAVKYLIKTELCYECEKEKDCEK